MTAMTRLQAGGTAVVKFARGCTASHSIKPAANLTMLSVWVEQQLPHLYGPGMYLVHILCWDQEEERRTGAGSADPPGGGIVGQGVVSYEAKASISVIGATLDDGRRTGGPVEEVRGLNKGTATRD